MRYRLSFVTSVIILAIVHNKKNCEHTSMFSNSGCSWFWLIRRRHVIRNGSTFNLNQNFTGPLQSKLGLSWFGRRLDRCLMLLTLCWINQYTWIVLLQAWPWGFEKRDPATAHLIYICTWWRGVGSVTLLMRLTFSRAECLKTWRECVCVCVKPKVMKRANNKPLHFL